MQQRLSDVTLGELGRGIGRYRSFIATVVAIVFIGLVLPGDPPTQTVDQVGGFDAGSLAAGIDGEGQRAVPQADGGAAAQGPTQIAAAGPAAAPAAVPTEQAAAELQEQGVDLGPFCDTSLGRIMIPSVYSAPCLPVHAGDNGGATYQGVTGDTITVAVYRGQENAAASAIVAAAGADDSREEVEATRQAYIDLFAHFYSTYGRTVELVYVEGSGEAEDDEAGKADAIRVATEIQAFASLGAPNNTYVDELVARQVLCICTVSQPIENYLAWAPYAGYTTLMASTQGYVHRAEYIGKRLAGRNAEWAGDPIFQVSPRTFALIYFETADQAYKSGADFFQQELMEKYGVPLADRIAYQFDLPQAQEQARTIIGRLNDADITSVVFSGDPLYPIFFTQEATRQNYHPEWIY